MRNWPARLAVAATLGTASLAPAQVAVPMPAGNVTGFLVTRVPGFPPPRTSSVYLGASPVPLGTTFVPNPSYVPPSVNQVNLYYFYPAPAVATPPAPALPRDWDSLLPREPRTDAVAPGFGASVFRPIRPGDRARANPAAARNDRRRQPGANQPGQGELPGLPGPTPPATAAADHAALTEMAHGALLARAYGRVEHFLSEAIALDPTDATALFTLAHARVALGKYREAVDTIRAGLAIRPLWPATGVRVRAWYGSGDFEAILGRLEGAVARHPDDPTLLFLQAYLFWFDGRRDEARAGFLHVKRLRTHDADCGRFLQTIPVIPGLL